MSKSGQGDEGKGEKGKMKSETSIVPVLHTLMIKELREASGGKVYAVGTLIQRVRTGWSGSPSQFPYRVGESQSGDRVVQRRVEEEGDLVRSNYVVELPLEVSTISAAFPGLEIFSAEVWIELSSTAENSVTSRPNLHINVSDARHNVSVRDASVLDKLIAYACLQPNPTVMYAWQRSKNYTPRFKIVYYLGNASGHVEIVILQGILVAALASSQAKFALVAAVVVFTGNGVPAGRNRRLSGRELYVALQVAGLSALALRDKTYGLLWLALLVPVLCLLDHLWLLRTLRRSTTQALLKDASYRDPPSDPSKSQTWLPVPDFTSKPVKPWKSVLDAAYIYLVAGLPPDELRRSSFLPSTS